MRLAVAVVELRVVDPDVRRVLRRDVVISCRSSGQPGPSSAAKALAAHHFALHHYVWNVGKGALGIDRDNWYETMAKTWAMDCLIEGHRSLMDVHDPERKVVLVVDEWGAWHKTDESKPGYTLYQQNTVRDAVVAAITLDIFNQRSGIVRMANLAQIVNVLHSLILADETRAVRTPSYHVFDLYRPHRGGEAVRCESVSDYLSGAQPFGDKLRELRLDGQPVRMRRVLGSATRKDDRLTLTLVNPDFEQTVEVGVSVFGRELYDAEIVELDHSSVVAHNTFEQPDAVTLTKPRKLAPGQDQSLALRPGAIVRLSAGLR